MSKNTNYQRSNIQFPKQPTPGVSEMSTEKDNGATIVLRDAGDVVSLIIGDKKLSVTASRTVLTIMSPVFKAMLTGRFREAETSTFEIPLPDDDPDALLLLLRIAHLRFKDLPERISFPDLYRLAVVCDKYDTVAIVRPFWDRYGAPFLDLVETVGYEQWLFIAWTFGFEDVYRRLMKKLVLEIILVKGDLYRLIDGGRKARALQLMLPPHASGKSSVLENHSQELVMGHGHRHSPICLLEVAVVANRCK